MLTVRHGDPETSRTRASQLDNLTFSSPTLGEAYPSDTAINKTTVGRQQEPPSQTILPSMSHARRGLPVRLGDYQANVGESLPARQLTFSVSSHLHSNPAECYTLDHQTTLASVHHRRGSTIRPTSINLVSEVVRSSRLDNLTFSSYVSEASHQLDGG